MSEAPGSSAADHANSRQGGHRMAPRQARRQHRDQPHGLVGGLSIAQ
jgi:hypothetical protein